MIFLLNLTAQSDHVENHYFHFADGDANVHVLDLNEKRIVFLFVFGETCTGCNKNVPMWNRIAGLRDLSCDDAFGITFSHSGMDKADSEMRCAVVRPVDSAQFKKKYDLRDGVDYTLVLHQGQLVHSVLGLLNAGDFFRIRERLKGLAAVQEDC